MRPHITALIIVAFGLASSHAGSSAPTSVGAAERPNIMFIMSDDHAAHAISAYGSRVNRTPNIDRIAREGMLMENDDTQKTALHVRGDRHLAGPWKRGNGLGRANAPRPFPF